MTIEGTTELTGFELHWEISQFLFEEAALLDAPDFTGWLSVLTEDIRYRMPVRLTRERKDGHSVDPDAVYIDEDLASLSVRAARLGTRSAWAEDPPSRTRHFVTNVVVRAGDAPAEVAVRSNLLFTRSRGGSTANDVLTGLRSDVLRRADGAWKLARREVVLDQTVLGTLNLSTLY
ncbi:3-phenylpropionate/cinnamic acid dioxygenase subunit beta [Pseudonocardia sp. KRD291]|uniref:3-phenylpropionate/cinnamic acid dioxygenase subunit beta n=1 Tax=Pseudonocardia sp. KRD291 TaxID=2792007 RepID=UPI001C5C5837|nr:3-phenylpropionate/cinnamic acid dioxygenase subunit beta [Pseudonocardia sp. KRD291]MBW0101436.1 3-phenylpropionate/cinnamic acid dioxygenase subunit beta [Pseudonocardia sp. KRD291]